MRVALVLSIAMIGTAVSYSITPFDRYIAEVKAHQPSSFAGSFARECGVKLAGKRPKYAVTNTGTWRDSHNLPQDVWNLESDSFDTAEMWAAKNGAEVVDWWDVDLEQDIDTLFCLDPSGRVRFLKSTNWTFAEEGYPTIEWVYKQRRNFDSTGKPLSKTGHFEDARGRLIHPKLTGDEARDFDWVPQGANLKDFGLEDVWQKR